MDAVAIVAAWRATALLLVCRVLPYKIGNFFLEVLGKRGLPVPVVDAAPELEGELSW